MPNEIALRHRMPHFLHLFGSDAYSAGYYSCLWSDVMAADTREAFVEAGAVYVCITPFPRIAIPLAPHSGAAGAAL
jgi:Zn-dependent oligopeptidase